MEQPKEINIEFFPDTHEYIVNGEKAKLSVTTLVETQVEKTDWSFIDPAILQKAADRGTEVHADLEHFVREGTEPKTQECKNFAEFLKTNNWKIEEPLCEFKLAIKHSVDTGLAIISFILSGTADLICKLNGKHIIVDHKTTSVIHEEYVRWQMSLLDYMARKLNGCIINEQLFTYHPAEELYVFHFDKQARFKPVKVDKISDTEIERLLDAEAKDEEYHPTPVNILTPKQQVDLLDIQKKICSLKAQQAILAKQEAILRTEMEAAFAAHPDTKKVELQDLSVSYTPPTERVTFDSAQFAQDHPELYAQYLKKSTVKASITITLSKKVKDLIEAQSSEVVTIPTAPKPTRKNTKRGFFN